ncbi:Epithelial cell adhesion molecule [Lonchura striata]|uniref:Epithelial cell adhesion molecule n=1 Tax=Lonchura striata TaxID=40157 RepID=A0A218V7U1_9PASE|nr:Epithelial cell adhesion molecule [Lonchura striata domestica]
MKPLCGAAFLLLLLCAAATAQSRGKRGVRARHARPLRGGFVRPAPRRCPAHGRASLAACVCEKNKRVSNCRLDNSGQCRCEAIGSGVAVDCSTLTSKCLLMKAEVMGSKSGRREKPKDAFEDTDGLYDPDCENSGAFKAKQCNGSTCWCVNTAGVRRTDKHDTDLKCNQLVRTILGLDIFVVFYMRVLQEYSLYFRWIIIEMKHAERNAPLNAESLKKFFTDTITSRYQLDGRYIANVLYENPYITIDLKQNSSAKSVGDVDIADVAYYFEKDVKGQSIFHSNAGLNISIDNEPVKFEKTVVYYVDEIAPEFSMKSLTPGLIAVIVVIVVAIVAAIVVLVLTRRRKGKYVKAEMKEMNEMHRGLNA